MLICSFIPRQDLNEVVRRIKIDEKYRKMIDITKYSEIANVELWHLKDPPNQSAWTALYPWRKWEKRDTWYTIAHSPDFQDFIEFKKNYMLEIGYDELHYNRFQDIDKSTKNKIINERRGLIVENIESSIGDILDAEIKDGVDITKTLNFIKRGNKFEMKNCTDCGIKIDDPLFKDLIKKYNVDIRIGSCEIGENVYIEGENLRDVYSMHRLVYMLEPGYERWPYIDKMYIDSK